MAEGFQEDEMFELSDSRIPPPARRLASDAEMVRRLVRRDTLHLGQIERLLAQAQAERFWWLERALPALPPARPEGSEDRLHAAIERMLETRLVARRRSWWRRWFG
jgi:hypothetical protein